MSSFILLLAYFDLSPKAFIYKATKRFFEPIDSLQPIPRDAPYYRRGCGKKLHKPVLLNLETSEGSGQACHPDIAYIPEGFGSQKWRYWMVCTPYPYGNDYFENPEIFASSDGLTWFVPKGLQNPVVPSPTNSGDHNSDPELVFRENELWLFYRLTLRSKVPRKVADEHKIYLMKSLDGVRWSAAIEVLTENSGTQLLSPAVVHDGTQFLMWTIECLAGDLKLMRRSSPCGLTWTPPQVAHI